MNSPDNRYRVDFEKSIERYSDMIYRIAVTITKNEEDAKDVFQETFLRLVRNHEKIVSEEHLKAWLIRVVSNCAKTRVSSPWNRNTQGFEKERETQESSYEPGENRLLSELKKLPQKYSVVLYLYYYEGYSIKEIGKLLEKNENTIKTLMSRGRELLRDKLEGGEQDE